MTATITDKAGVASPWVPALATIVSIKQEAPAVATYRLCFDDQTMARTYRFEAGQFNMLGLPGIGESAISISSDPADFDGLDHTIRAVGNVTSNLAKRKPGAKIAVRGPFGSAWPVDNLLGRDIVLACGGLGLAPMRPVLRIIGAAEPNSAVSCSFMARARAKRLVVYPGIRGMAKCRH